MGRMIGVVALLACAGCFRVVERPICVEEIRELEVGEVIEGWTEASLIEVINGDWSIDGEYLDGEVVDTRVRIASEGLPMEQIVRTHGTEETRELGFGGTTTLLLMPVCNDELRMPVRVKVDTADAEVEVNLRGFARVPLQDEAVEEAREAGPPTVDAWGSLSGQHIPFFEEDPADWYDTEVYVNATFSTDEESEAQNGAPQGELGWSGSKEQGDTAQHVVEPVLIW